MTVAFYVVAILFVGVLFIVAWGKHVNKALLVAIGVLPVVAIYVLNPEFKVYSFHSFMHAGIVYQILNGNIPPCDPLVAGETVNYPWGSHLVAAGMTKLFRVTPFVSLAGLNVISLVVALMLVYAISRRLVPDERANILSVVVSLYGITFAYQGVMKYLPSRIPVDFRGVPALLKFITINNLPLGLVFFLLFVHSTIRLWREEKMVASAVLFWVSVAGTGFFYTPFLPGLCVSAAAACFLGLVLRRYESLRVNPRTALLVGALLVAGILPISRYLASISAGTVSQAKYFVPINVTRNIVKYVIILLPVMVVITLSKKYLVREVSRRVLMLLVVATSATAAVFFVVNLPLENEYKLQVLSTVTLGIVGGPAFAHLLARSRRAPIRFVVFLVLAVFLIPALRFFGLKLTRELLEPGTYIEKGMNISTKDDEADAFYQWIRDNTDRNSVFVDTDLEIPVLAQRQLLIGAGPRGRRQRKGYGAVDMILRLQSGYDREMLDRRTRIAEKVYGSADRLTPDEIGEISGLPGDLYVVVRQIEQVKHPAPPAFEPAFTSSRGNIILYKLVSLDRLGMPRAPAGAVSAAGQGAPASTDSTLRPVPPAQGGTDSVQAPTPAKPKVWKGKRGPKFR